MFEVTREAEPRIVWSWVNHIGEAGGKPMGGVVGGSFRFPPGALRFVDERAVAGDSPAAAPGAYAACPRLNCSSASRE